MAVADTDVNIFDDTENSGNGGGGGGGTTEVTLFSSRNTITTEEVSPGEWDVNVAGEESLRYIVSNFHEFMEAVVDIGVRKARGETTSCVIQVVDDIFFTDATLADEAEYTVNGTKLIDVANKTFLFDWHFFYTTIMCEGTQRHLQLLYPDGNNIDTWQIRINRLRLNNVRLGGGISLYNKHNGTSSSPQHCNFSRYLLASQVNLNYDIRNCQITCCGADNNLSNKFIYEGNGTHNADQYHTTITLSNCNFFYGGDAGNNYWPNLNAPIVIYSVLSTNYSNQRNITFENLTKYVGNSSSETGCPNIQFRTVDNSDPAYDTIAAWWRNHHWRVTADGTCLVSSQIADTIDLKTRLALNDIYIQGQPALQPEGATPLHNGVSLVDFLTAGFKRGVISQTQTWSGSSSIGYTYTMSDLVYGNIPIAFIEQWNTICKCSAKDGNGSFNDVTGYFEANGLVDISYEEAILIVSLYSGKSTSSSGSSFSLYGNGIHPRTTLDLMDGNRRWSSGYQDFQPSYLLILSKIETIYVIDTHITNSKLLIQQCERLRNVYGIFTITYNSQGNVYIDASSLENINIKGLYKDAKVKSPKLDFNSLVYMIQNCYKAQNPSASDTFTLTVHSNTYNVAVSDTNTYTWEGNSYTGIMNLATAVGCTIVSA